jgi:hypothetical protein
MNESYAITVSYTSPPLGYAAGPTTLHLNANNADLAALLRVLDVSVHVASYSVASTVAVPLLHVMSKLTCADMGIAEHQLFKLK